MVKKNPAGLLCSRVVFLQKMIRKFSGLLWPTKFAFAENENSQKLPWATTGL